MSSKDLLFRREHTIFIKCFKFICSIQNSHKPTQYKELCRLVQGSHQEGSMTWWYTHSWGPGLKSPGFKTQLFPLLAMRQVEPL